MAKRKVISVFGVLLFLAIVLSVISLSQMGGITGNVIASKSQTQELFIGSEYEFAFHFTSVKSEDEVLQVKGTLNELVGSEHYLDITTYAISKEGEIIGSYTGKAFLAAEDEIFISVQVPLAKEENVYQTIIYFDDGKTMIKDSYHLGKRFISGNVVASISSDEGSRTLIFIILIFVAAFLVIGVLKSHKSNNKQVHFSDSLDKKQSRKFIDIDFR